MARKVTVNKTNTIDIWRQKVNQMSDYIEDLNDLDETFEPGDVFDPNYPKVDADSNIISSLNYVSDYLNNIQLALLGGSSAAPTPASTTFASNINAKLFVDSGVFNKVTVDQLWNYDDAMTRADSDATWYGDSPGTAKFDFNADSAVFGNLTVTRLRQAPDSATFGRLTILDSGHINSITADSGSTVFFKHLTARGKDIVIDSALALDRITVGKFISDSGSDSGVNITKTTIGNVNINKFSLTDSHGLDFQYARPFRITDDAGSNYFAAIQLDIDAV